MVLRHLVKRRVDDLALDAALHFCYLFRPFINEQHHQRHLRMVDADGIGHLSQNGSLSCARRRYDQPALSFADGAHQVNDAQDQHILHLGIFQRQPFVGDDGRQFLKRRSCRCLIRRLFVDKVYIQQRQALISVRASWPGTPLDLIPGS